MEADIPIFPMPLDWKGSEKDLDSLTGFLECVAHTEDFEGADPFKNTALFTESLFRVFKDFN